MLNKTQSFKENDSRKLAFLASSKVNVFPCGRRRSPAIASDTASNSTEYNRIPFDPEARLNTELNNRNHSSINGFDSTYIKSFNSSTGILTTVLGNYSFKLNFLHHKTSDILSLNDIGTAVSTTIFGQESNKQLQNLISKGEIPKIYANIRIEHIALTSSDSRVYYSEVLRNQSDSRIVEDHLDLLVSSEAEPTDASNYYFSGISFSLFPITEKSEKENFPRSSKESIVDAIKHTEISLCILEYNTSTNQWEICQQALLPDIKHGELEDSVEFDTIIAQKIYIKDEQKQLNTVPALRLKKINEASIFAPPIASKYQLQFSSVEVIK